MPTTRPPGYALASLGLTGVGAGLALLIRPQLLSGALRLGDSDAVRWLPRLLAIRELALGVGATAASRDKADPWPWLMTIAAVDGAEAVVLAWALRSRSIDPFGGFAFVAADLGSASAVALRVGELACPAARSQSSGVRPRGPSRTCHPQLGLLLRVSRLFCDLSHTECPTSRRRGRSTLPSTTHKAHNGI